MDVVATEDTVMANASRGNNDAADDERQGRDERVNLYVRGVGEGVKDTDLEALFGKYGEVMAISGLKQDSNKPLWGKDLRGPSLARPLHQREPRVCLHLHGQQLSSRCCH